MKKFSYLDMVKTLLPEEEFEAFIQSYTQSLKKSIKILKSNQHNFSTTHKQLTNDGRSLTPPNFSRKGKNYDDVFFVDKTDKQSLWSHLLHQQGAFYVQEIAAGLPTQILNVQPGEIVLDLCAAPGGKSIQLADKLWFNGLLIANELNPSRRKALKANLERCGIRNNIITGYDGKQLGNLLYEQCDKVLLDAPCSGEGMQYKSDFKIYQWNEKQVRKLAHIQYELLTAGFKALKIWGELVYSTCTTNTIENEGVVTKILEELGDSIELVNVEIEEKSKGIGIDHVARFRPHIHHTGGFFIAKFKKNKPTSYLTSNNEQHLNREQHQRKILENKQIQQHSKKRIPSEIIFLQTKHTIRAVTKKAVWFLDILYIDQAGLPIFKVLNNNEWKPLEGLEKLSNSKN